MDDVFGSLYVKAAWWMSCTVLEIRIKIIPGYSTITLCELDSALFFLNFYNLVIFGQFFPLALDNRVNKML